MKATKWQTFLHVSVLQFYTFLYDLDQEEKSTHPRQEHNLKQDGHIDEKTRNTLA